MSNLKVRFPEGVVYKGGEFHGVLRFCVVGGGENEFYKYYLYNSKLVIIFAV